jgi:hypothetical protein
MTRSFIAHPSNVAGPFYVVDGECMGCGAPESEAGAMMSHDGSGHCFFISQPCTPDQVNSAIRALWSSCCNAVRYSGSDSSILTRIGQLGLASTCDEKANKPLSKIVRNCVSFTYGDERDSVESNIRRIIIFIMDSQFIHSGGRCSGIEYGRRSGSFLFHWGTSDLQFSIRFHVAAISERRWLARIEENQPATLGMAMSLDTSLQSSDLFGDIRWFTEAELGGDTRKEAVHPY